MSDKTTGRLTVATPSVGAFGVVGAMFIILKLAGVITWPWVWVLAPFWLVVVFAVVLITVGLVYTLLAILILGLAKAVGK